MIPCIRTYLPILASNLRHHYEHSYSHNDHKNHDVHFIETELLGQLFVRGLLAVINTQDIICCGSVEQQVDRLKSEPVNVSFVVI